MLLQNFTPASAFGDIVSYGQTALNGIVSSSSLLDTIGKLGDGVTERSVKAYRMGENLPSPMLTNSTLEVDMLYRTINNGIDLGGSFDLGNLYGFKGINFGDVLDNIKKSVSGVLDSVTDTLSDPSFYGGLAMSALQNYKPLTEKFAEYGIDFNNIKQYSDPNYAMKSIGSIIAPKVTDFIKSKIPEGYGLSNNLPTSMDDFKSKSENALTDSMNYGMSKAINSKESALLNYKQSKHYTPKTDVTPSNYNGTGINGGTVSDKIFEARDYVSSGNSLFSKVHPSSNTDVFKYDDNFSQGYLVSRALYGNAMVGDRSSWEDYMNKFKTYMNTNTEIDATYGTRGHVFFTRPDCNLNAARYSEPNYNPNGGLSQPLTRVPSFTSPMTYDNAQYSYITRYMDRDVADEGQFKSKYNFIPFMSNLFKDFSPPGMTSTRYEGVSNSQGLRFDLDVDSSNNDVNQQLSFTFKNDAMGTVSRFMGMMYDYSEHVNAGRISPKIKHIRDNAVDYAITAYGFLVEPDGRTIRHSFKITGLTPNGSGDGNEPYSNEYKINDSVPVTFNTNLPIKYRKIEDMFEFNLQMGHEFACQYGWWNSDIHSPNIPGSALTGDDSFKKVVIAKNIEKLEYLFFKYNTRETEKFWWTNEAMIVIHEGQDMVQSGVNVRNSNLFSTADAMPRLVYLPNLDMTKEMIIANINSIRNDPVCDGWLDHLHSGGFLYAII